MGALDVMHTTLDLDAFRVRFYGAALSDGFPAAGLLDTLAGLGYIDAVADAVLRYAGVKGTVEGLDGIFRTDADRAAVEAMLPDAEAETWDDYEGTIEAWRCSSCGQAPPDPFTIRLDREPCRTRYTCDRCWERWLRFTARADARDARAASGLPPLPVEWLP